MKIKDMIKKLKAIKKEHGNIDVGTLDVNGCGDTELLSFSVEEVMRYWRDNREEMVIFKKSSEY